jgi:Tfp pilus assembly protein PilN
MIQFNLLPDIKIQYLRAKRQKHLVLLGSILVSVASVAILVILISIVFVLQKKSINDLSKDITAASSELESTPDLTKMLTVQNQLKSLTGLHDKKPEVPRLFGYITQTTPTSATISRLNVEFAKSSISISGTADTLGTVNTFVDTLKFSTYRTKNAPSTEKPAFTNVVLSAFGRDTTGAIFTINMQFDPVIFSQKEDVTMTVPKKITTRSEIEQPAALFKAQGQQ